MYIIPERKRGYVFEIVSFFGFQITRLAAFSCRVSTLRIKLHVHHPMDGWYWKGKPDGFWSLLEITELGEYHFTPTKSRLIEAVIQVYLHSKFQLWQPTDKT